MEQKNKRKAPICFKRWKRSPWAAFASMGKTIKIGVLCVTYSILVLRAQPVLAQSQSKSGEITERALEELIVSSERPTPFQPLVRVVAVIQAPEIERAAVRNLQDLLRYIQGVDLRSRGSEGVQADLNILGGTFDQTMVMINGINFTDPQTGHHSLNIPVELSQIERIEVLHGPGAWSNGSVAYSGAINIITKKSEKNSISANVSGGSFGYFKAGGNLGFSPKAVADGWSVSGNIGGGYSRSDGYSENTDFEIANGFATLSATKKGHSFDLAAGVQDKAFGANSFYSVKYPNQYERTRLGLFSAQYHYSGEKWNVNVSIYQRRHFDRFELFRENPATWYTGHNYHQNDVFGAGVSVGRRWGVVGTTVIGGEYRYENIYSNVLGLPISETKDVPFEGGKKFTKQLSRNTPSVYARHILNIGSWRFTAGVMASNTFVGDWGQSGYGTKVNAGFAASYQITPYLEANMWLNNSYRNPTFTDLFYKSPTQTGNANLKPEEAVSAQLGVRYISHSLRASVSGFYRHGYRIIDWVRATSSDQWQSANITNVASQGIDLNVTYIWKNCFIQRAGFDFSYLNVSKDSKDMHSLYATDFLRNKGRIFLDHKIVSKLDASWNVNFQKREGTYLDKNNVEVNYKPFSLVDLKLTWREKKFSIFAEATNLFNIKYFDLGNLDQPGIWIKSGLNINF